MRYKIAQFVLGYSFELFLYKTPLNEPLVLFSRVSYKNNPKQHRHYFDCDLLCKSTTNQTHICNISSLRADSQNLRGKTSECEVSCNPFSRFCDSQNLAKNNPCEAPKTKFLFLLAFCQKKSSPNPTRLKLTKQGRFCEFAESTNKIT